jgi:hypothetical protein
MEATEKKFREQQSMFAAVLPDHDPVSFGLDPSWVKIYPYQMLLRPGQKQIAEVRVQNYKPSGMKMEVALVAPSEWSIEPNVLKFEVPANGKSARRFDLTLPRDWAPPSPRFAIAADVIADGRYLGQITEAVVDIAS